MDLMAKGIPPGPSVTGATCPEDDLLPGHRAILDLWGEGLAALPWHPAGRLRAEIATHVMLALLRDETGARDLFRRFTTRRTRDEECALAARLLEVVEEAGGGRDGDLLAIRCAAYRLRWRELTAAGRGA